MSFSVLVDERRILQHRIGRHPPPVHQFPEEAALAAGVAGNAAHLLHPEQQRIGVAVDAHLAQLLHVAGLLALSPEPLARARPVDGFLARHRLFQRFAVHPRDPEHPARGKILRDHGNEPLLVPRHLVEPFVHMRTSMPRLRMCSFAWRTVNSPKWKTLAASTASAWPSLTPWARCSRLPTPPEAITGTPTASDTARVSSRSNPSRVPSRSMLVSRISPAPAPCMRFAQSMTSIPVARRPPSAQTSRAPPLRLASVAATM